MSDEIKISLVQFDIAWENQSLNLNFLEEHLSDLTTDLIILPEMFTTGFTMKPSGLSEKMTGDTIEWMKSMSKKIKTAICGSLIIEENNKFYNRFIFVDGDSVSYYNKKHLFTYAGENRNYTSGTERRLIEFRGWRILPQICYDLRFPVWSRNVDNYDLIIYVANWPEKRRNHWLSLLKARSIENQSFLVGVNRIGKDGNDLQYSGDSVAFSPLGEEIVNCQDQIDVKTITINKIELERIRKEFPFLTDKDSFILNNL